VSFRKLIVVGNSA